MSTGRLLWRLRHAWHLPSDLAALRICAEALAHRGLQLARARHDGGADALKWHGAALVHAVRTGDPMMVDLALVARSRAWERTLHPLARAFMQHGERWHGIPLAMHRSSCLWVHPRFAGPAVQDWPALIAWLETVHSRCRWPLALGREPWMLGVLFENAMLSIGGPAFYRQALVAGDASAWRTATALDALEGWLSMRRFVDLSQASLGWVGQLRRVIDGRAALLFCGDWAGVARPGSLIEWACPSATASLALVDFLVPLDHGEGLAASQRAFAAATALAQPGVLQRIATVKGATSPFDIADAQAVLPSVSFEQVFSPADTQQWLGLLWQLFEAATPARCAQALADWMQRTRPCVDFLEPKLERSNLV